MSGARIIPMPRRAAALADTVADAERALTKPLFGDERCIAARKLLELAAEVREYRRIAIARRVDGRSLRNLHWMTTEDLCEEIDEWQSAGVGKVQS